jgi:4-hydroxy-3-methylbut-2-en-1-yl diphosphate synthase IspG/GcpE
MNYRTLTDVELLRESTYSQCQLTAELAKRLSGVHLQEQFSNAKQNQLPLYGGVTEAGRNTALPINKINT